MINKHIRKEKRSVLLYIPSLVDCKGQDVKAKISMLRRSVNFSVAQVSDILNNNLFKEFSDLNKCFYERGLPQIDVQTTDVDTFDVESNIRICLTKYNDIDFMNGNNLAVDIIGKNKISHLIELHLNEKVKKISWKKSLRVDSSGNPIFDVAVVTPLGCLYKVILSIMIDIYCYYIVGFSSDFDFRRAHSQNKVRYLDESYGKTKLKLLYGINETDFFSNISYLPVSMLYDLSSNNLCLKQTIDEYVKIIKEVLIVELNKSSCDYYRIMTEFEKMDKNEVDNVYYVKSKEFSRSEIKEIRNKIEILSNSNEYIEIKFLHNRWDEPIEFFCFSNIEDILQLYPYFEWYKIAIDKY